MMIRKVTLLTGFLLGLLLLSAACAPVAPLRATPRVLAVEHVRGGQATCLSDCVEMVMRYYGMGGLLTDLNAQPMPSNLLAMDSLVNALPPILGNREVHSYVLRKDAAFVRDQLARERPVILILPGRRPYHHSVVVAGVSANGRALYVLDPARRQGRWLARARLMARWQQTGGLLMLIGVTDDLHQRHYSYRDK